jgi:uncharacterized protein YecE (DUF72 family)
VRSLASSAAQTQVFFNNCYTDYAQRNAKTFLELL